MKPSHFPIQLPVQNSDLQSLPDLPELLPEGQWYQAENIGQGLSLQGEPGFLTEGSHLTCDFYLEGTAAATFAIDLQEGDRGPRFHSHFAFIPQCQARIRLPLSSVNQNRWLFPREGAWLKFIVGGDRVDLEKVDRIFFSCLRKGPEPVRWCMTPLSVVEKKPALLQDPICPQGPLLDELGQSRLKSWSGKTQTLAEMITRMQERSRTADQAVWPASFSQFGGCRDLRFDASGFFRTHHDGARWWLVDPEGYAFWSAGLDCVRSHVEANATDQEHALSWNPEGLPEFKEAWTRKSGGLNIDYLRCNLIRAFGADHWHAHWKKMALADLKHFGFNTMANWSEWELAQVEGFPYVRPLQWPVRGSEKAPRIFRDFPDPFDPLFSTEAAAFAQQLLETRDDPALVGYFLMNEPNWGFASMCPAEGMLYQTEGGAARRGLAEFLRERYEDHSLAENWGEGVSFQKLAAGRWTDPLTETARGDLEAYSRLLVEKLYSTLSTACKNVDPDHLNLGARYHRVPPDWAIPGMQSFDVFSINCYREVVDESLGRVCGQLNMPALIGEWHFGALDAGLPATGIGHVRTQADRGRAFRIYTEDAATRPWCVGVHYFTYLDQSALGRGDGENYNIGFVDICMKPYEDLVKAARESHERLYDLARGLIPPSDDRPEYLPRLFY